MSARFKIGERFQHYKIDQICFYDGKSEVYRLQCLYCSRRSYISASALKKNLIKTCGCLSKPQRTYPY